MGLDIYVGSLTRYYAGNWELRAQTVSREIGIECEVVRKQNPPDAIRDPDQIRPSILAWRQQLSQALNENLGAPLDWNESEDAPYFTDKPCWDCYSDLVLWAAYEEQPQMVRPRPHIDNWSVSPGYKASTADGFPSRYSQLYDVEMWLPCPFEFVFKSEDVGGSPITIGSSVSLLRQLETLNQRSWHANADLLAKWAFEGAEHGAPLENGARFAFAIVSELANRSVEHRLPMRLDW